MRFGVTASYRGILPPSKKGLPNIGKDSIEFEERMRNDISKGRMSLCSHEIIGGDDYDFETTTTTFVSMRNPERSWSADNRIVSELRMINSYVDQSAEYPEGYPRRNRSLAR